MRLILSAHAALAIQERRLGLDWLERAISEPDRSGPDPDDPTATRAFKMIPEAGGRFIRVVHRPRGHDIFVITAFLDRGAKQ